MVKAVFVFFSYIVKSLKVMINGQPHSVGLDDLGKEDKNGFYHVSLKVDPKLLQKNRYIDIQFATSGYPEVAN